MTTFFGFNTARLVDAACRTYFSSFARMCFHILNPGAEFLPNWHHRALDFHLDEVRRGNIKRLAVALPPRYGKSFTASIAFPAFVLGLDPTKRIIVVSYNADLAAKLSYDFRAIVEDTRYQRLFPAMRLSRNTEFEVVTDQHGYRFATSVDGTLTGRGGDILIIDDYLKPNDALSDIKRAAANNWFFNTALSRLDDKQNGAIVIIGHRLHVDDLIGTVMRSDDWRLLSLPAIAEKDQIVQIGDELFYHRRAGEALHPEREPRHILESTRSQVGADTFEPQYQQNPMLPGGAMIRRDWVLEYDQLPQRTSSSVVIQSWDTASHLGEANARSACTTWLLHENSCYLMDLLVGQFDYLVLKEHAVSLARVHKPGTILIEDTGVGTALIAELKRAGLPAVPVKPEQDKRTRMAVQIPKFANGQIFFAKHKPWRAVVDSEVFAFPNGRYDDIVDSISQALAYESTTFDAVKFFDGMGRLHSALVLQRLFPGRVV
jgi:predicted phage terminase large subunit-like protein